MTNEDFQKLILEKLVNMEQDLAEVKTNMATKQELADVKAELKGDIADVKAELKTDIADVRSELKADIASLDTKIDNLDAKLEHYAAEQQKDLKTMFELMSKKLDRITETQTTQQESINILATRELSLEAEFSLLKKQQQLQQQQSA